MDKLSNLHRNLQRLDAHMRMTRRSLLRGTSDEVRQYFASKLMAQAKEKLEIQAKILKHNDVPSRLKE